MISRLPFPIRSLSLPPASFLCSSLTNPNQTLTVPSQTQTQTPLFLRPLTHSATRSDLQTFRQWAETLARSHFPPRSPTSIDSPHLLRELSWLLQDATSHSAPNSNSIHLRCDLADLYNLWNQRVLDRKPFQYILGCEHWRDLVLMVRDGVLIPRPETEMLVDLGREVEGFEEGLWADLGTGSGAIAVGIGRCLGEKGRVLGTDLSEIAVETARFNVERYGLEGKVEIRQGSWFEPLRDVEGKLDGLVSNPPYIPSEDIAGLQAEVGWHEPRLALDGGEDGVDCLVHLCEGAASALKPGGFFAFETNGKKQTELIAELMSTKWGKFFRDIKTVLDFAGIKRFVTGFRHELIGEENETYSKNCAAKR